MIGTTIDLILILVIRIVILILVIIIIIIIIMEGGWWWWMILVSVPGGLIAMEWWWVLWMVFRTTYPRTRDHPNVTNGGIFIKSLLIGYGLSPYGNYRYIPIVWIIMKITIVGMEHWSIDPILGRCRIDNFRNVIGRE